MDLQKLTLSWLRAMDVDRPSHFLGATVAPAAREAIRDLERAADLALHADSEPAPHQSSALDRLLDDTTPEDLLGRIENSVRTLQGWTLRSIMDHVKPAERLTWLGNLEQSSWNSGRESAFRRWADVDAAEFADLRRVIDAFRESALGSGPGHEDFLLIRATRAEAWIDFRACPHRHPNAATLLAADALCGLHAHWIRGYLYALNPRILLEPRPTPDRKGGAPAPGAYCAQRWVIQPSGSDAPPGSAGERPGG